MARSPALQAMMDKAKNSASIQQMNQGAAQKQFGAKGSAQSQAGVSNYDVKYNTSSPNYQNPLYTSNSPSYSSGSSSSSGSSNYSSGSSGSYSSGSSSGYSGSSQQLPQTPQLQMPDINGLTQQTLNEIMKKANQGLSLVKPDAQKQSVYDYYANQNKQKNESSKDSGYKVGEMNKPAFGSKDWMPPNLFAPGASAQQSAGFNGSNWNDMSGVYLGNADTGEYKQVSHKDATSNNPLHPLNANNNKLIMDAIASGDWSKYDQFQSTQAPGHYTDGQKNKEYYATLLESSVRAKNEAQMNGDTAGVQHWENAIQTRLADMKNAPGMMPSIIGINNNAASAQQYGVSEADPNWYNSEYNNPQVRQDGRFEQNMWYDNAMYQNDPSLLQNVLGIANQGASSPEEQQIRNQVNAGAYQQPNAQATSQYDEALKQQQAQYDAQLKAMQDMIDKFEKEKKEAENKADYEKGEITDANQGGSSGGSSSDGSHIFAPNVDEIKPGGVGYTQSENSMNEALYRFLNNMWSGGF